LAYLLRRFGVEATFCTTTIGVTPSFQAQPFYSNAITQVGVFLGNSFDLIKITRDDLKNHIFVLFFL
jgi:hypothetical protein